jgi:hypothetical protein
MIDKENFIMVDFPSELETLVLCSWSRDENGVLRAEYPNGAGFMLLRNETVEYWEVCSDGSFVLVEWRELIISK